MSRTAEYWKKKGIKVDDKTLHAAANAKVKAKAKEAERKEQQKKQQAKQEALAEKTGGRLAAEMGIPRQQKPAAKEASKQKAEAKLPAAPKKAEAKLPAAPTTARDTRDASVRKSYAQRTTTQRGGLPGEIERAMNSAAVHKEFAQQNAARQSPQTPKWQADYEALAAKNPRSRLAYEMGVSPTGYEQRVRDPKYGAALLGSVGTGIPGSVLSAGETQVQGLRNRMSDLNNAALEKKRMEYLALADQYRKANSKEAQRSILAQMERKRKEGDALMDQTAVDQNKIGQRLTAKSRALHAEATEGLKGFDRFLADSAASIGTNLPAIGLGVANPMAGLGLMGIQAAGAKSALLNERGIDARESARRGIGSGVIEAGTERIPLANLSKILKTGLGKSALQGILRQSGLEGGEEAVAYTLNFLADKAAHDPEARFSMQELGNALAMGAVSGLAFGAGGSAIHAMRRPVNPPNATQGPEMAASGPRPIPRAPVPTMPEVMQIPRADTPRIPEVTAINKQEDAPASYGDNGTSPPPALQSTSSHEDIKQLLSQGRRVPEAMADDVFMDQRIAETQDAVKHPTAPDAETMGAAPSQTTDMKKTIQEYQNSVDGGLLAYAQAVKEGRVGRKERYPLAPLSDRTAKEVSELVGFDVSGYQTALMPQTMEHIQNYHGQSGIRDQSMSELEDVARIQYVLDHYDTVSLSLEKTPAFTDSRGKPSQTVIYKKRINGHYYVIQAVPNSAKKTNFIVSAFRAKAGAAPYGNVGKAVAGQQPQGAKSPWNTSETETVVPATIPTIPRVQGGVKNTPTQAPVAFDAGTTVGAAPSLPTAEQAQMIQKTRASGAALGVAPETLDRITALAKGFRVPIEFVETLGSRVNGKYENGTIYLAKDAENPAIQVFTHELTHHIERSGQYNALATLTRRYLESSGADVAAITKTIQRLYAKDGLVLDQAGAQKEVVAAFLEGRGLFEDEAFVRRLTQENPSLARRVLDWLRDTLRKFGANADTRFLIDAQRLYERAMRDGKEVNDATPLAQYSVDKYFARQIDQWDGTDHGGAFRVGKPSDALLAVGMPNTDIWFDQSKAAKQLMEKGEITKSILKAIPALLEHPIVLAESYDSTIMAFGELYENGDKTKPIVVAVRINASHRRNQITLVNKIRSVGTRTRNLDQILAEENILYLAPNKKETNAWFNALGRSTPVGGTKYGLIRSISQIRETGKPQYSTKPVPPEDMQAAQKEQKKSATEGGTAQFSIRYDRDNVPFVVMDHDILEGVPREQWIKTVKENLRTKFPDGVQVGNQVIHINNKSWAEMTFSKYSQRLMKQKRSLFADKLRATNHADEILKASRNYVNEALMHPRKDNVQDFARGEVRLRIGDKAYSAKVVVAMFPSGKLLLYDILALRPTMIQEKGRTQKSRNPPQGETGSRSAFDQDAAAIRAVPSEPSDESSASDANTIAQEAAPVKPLLSKNVQAAQKEQKKSATKGGTAQFSIRYDRNNVPFVVMDHDILEGVPREQWIKTVKENLRTKFPDGVQVGNQVIDINGKSRSEMTFSKYAQRLMKEEPSLFVDKLKITNHADEVLKASRNYVNEALMHPRKDDVQDFARGEVRLRIGDKAYSAQVVVAMLSSGRLLLYDILALRPTMIQEKGRTQKFESPPQSEIERRSAFDQGADYITKAHKEPGNRQSTPDTQILAQDASDVKPVPPEDMQAAQKEQKKSATKGGTAQFSIRYDRNNVPFVVMDHDILEGVPRNRWVKTVKENLRTKFPDGVQVGNQVIHINAKSWGEMTFSKYAQRLMEQEPGLFADKLKITDNVDDILRASRNYVNEALMHPRKDNIQDFARGDVLIRIGKQEYSAQVVVGMRTSGALLLYDVLALRPTKIQEKGRTQNPAHPPQGETGSSSAFDQDAAAIRAVPSEPSDESSASDANTIAQEPSDVKPVLSKEGAQFSIHRDVNGDLFVQIDADILDDVLKIQWIKSGKEPRGRDSGGCMAF